MTFKRWPSIENSYRQKFIDVFLAEFPELANEIFVITEKIHGQNRQVFFQPRAPYRVGTRQQFIDEGGFYEVRIVGPEYQKLFEKCQAVVDDEGGTLRLFGEFFGPGLTKGINYGKKKRLVFFGFMRDDVLRSPSMLFSLINNNNLMPRTWGMFSLKDALAFDPGVESEFSRDKCEGVVIQPYSKVFVNNGGHTFMLKKKNEKFREKRDGKREPVALSPDVQALQDEFKLYLTETRLQNVFSNHGEIDDVGQISTYIKLMLNDAKKDFLKDYNEAVEALDKKSQRKVYSVGGMIAGMLKEHL